MASSGRLKWLAVKPNDIKAHWPKTGREDENWYWKWYSLERDVSWGSACVNVTHRCVWEFTFVRLTTALRPDWRSWDVAFWLSRARVGYWGYREKLSIPRVQGLPVVCIRLLQDPFYYLANTKKTKKCTYHSVTRSNELYEKHKLGSHQRHFSLNMGKFKSNYINWRCDDNNICMFSS